MKKIVALLLVFAMVFCLAACNKPQNDPSDPSDPTGSSTSTQPTGNPESETPMKLQWFQSIGTDTQFEAPAQQIQSLYPYMIFDPLMYWDALNAEMVPAMASEWTKNKDYTEFTVTIREGVKFHDGEVMDVNDVVFTINYVVASPTSSYHGAFQHVEGYEALRNGEAKTLSGMTVKGNVITFKLTQPVAQFLEGICGACYVLPEHLLKDYSYAEIDSCAFWKKPVGTGAYMVNEVSFPDYFTATRFDDYWGEPAGIKNVQFVSYAAGGNDAAVAAVINNEIDFATRQLITDNAVATNMVAQNSNLKALVVNGFYTRFFTFNLGDRADGKMKADLQNPKVRQAFDLLIDQETIASFFDGYASASMTAVSSAGSEYNTDIPNVAKDVAAAKKLLDEAGFDYSQTIDIATYYDDATTADIMALLVQDFAEAGVKVNTILLQGDLAGLIYTDKNYDLIYGANNAAANNQLAIYNFLCSNSVWTYQGKHEERGAFFDDLMAQYNASSDSAVRKDIAWKVQANNYENCYLIPAYILNNSVVYNTANIVVPEEVFEVDGGNMYCWDKWAVLN